MPGNNKAIERLPHMAIRDTVTVWQNTQRILADPKNSGMHQHAKEVLAAVYTEWARRGQLRLKQEGFKWPTTEARTGRFGIDTEEWEKEGLLQYMGYHVGIAKGLNSAYRERILSEIFVMVIPPVFFQDYMTEWSAPGTSMRLQKMAETIAALTRNARRRRDARMQSAIKDWESDLEFLYFNYYVGHFRFVWPVGKI
jgi:hypothetical protein